MNVVVVESPAKASTINKYLGPDYVVLASYGHVRDLPPKDGSVRPDDNFEMTWMVSDGAEKNIRAIGNALKGAQHLYLATDPDREGEAISWHVMDELKGRNLLNGIAVERVVFTEITKSAVLAAMANPRRLDDDLVDAYRARRALDYLVGFTLSPILWRKLPGSRSAGRVQSVALRLICEREAAIEAFVAREYWTVAAKLKNTAGAEIEARLTHLDGEKLDKYDLPDEARAMAARDRVAAGDHAVRDIEAKRTRRNPAPPFTTSTLQQEASRKLSFTARQTMGVAQQLYEGVALNGERVGLITYMRTDGVHIAAEAVQRARATIEREYGARYMPDKPPAYRSQAKNAQEAHEAIRPTDLSRLPGQIRGALSTDQARLYELIWKRTMASQMASAEIDQTAIVIQPGDGGHTLRATGSVIAFDGFLRLYQEGRDDPSGEDGERRLPQVRKGEALALAAVVPEQHFTEPPPRFSEASLVKELERLGIGRPSTYASIISVLQDRNYVRLVRRRFIPEDRGRIVTVFLENFFRRYVEYDFTASLESELDNISNGQIEWHKVLGDFWTDFKSAIDETAELRIKQVIEVLDEALAPHLFPDSEDGTDPRVCPSCDDGRLNLKLGKHGPFIGCSNYPECRHTRPLNGDGDADAGPREIGTQPESGLAITLRKGPFGHYLQLGETGEDGKSKPRRVSLPRDVVPDTVDLETALGLLALPRDIGPHPEGGKMITAGIGRFGPYVKHDGKFKSLKKDDDVLSIGLNRAISLLAEVSQRGASVLRELGNHPDDGAPVTVKEGRYGPYVQHKRTNATLPKGVDQNAISLDEAVVLLAAKAAKKKGGAKKKSAAKSGAKKKTAAKKRKSPAKTAVDANHDSTGNS
ncbi:MAG TPA: type I DNA topoisomerase [Alphaproteobacteria bacterium]|nr:type I DNA topoisomerase [Alphaproteobacteria bacterium]